MDAEHSDSTTKDVKMSDSVDTSRNNSAVQSESHKSELRYVHRFGLAEILAERSVAGGQCQHCAAAH